MKLVKNVFEKSVIKYVLSVDPEVRSDYYLHSHLRMKDANGTYIKVLHRMFYLAYDSNGCARFALCLYNVSLSDISEHFIINSSTGETFVPETCSLPDLLRLNDFGWRHKSHVSILLINK